MPFPYQSSAAPTRTRRPRDRDKDGRNSTSSSSGRRHKEISRSSTRTPPHILRPAQPSLYNQQNFTSDQLPDLPGSDSGALTPSASPPVPPAATTLPSPASSMTLPAHQHLHTPAALQPYLDNDNDDDEEDEKEEHSFTTVPETRTSPKDKEASRAHFDAVPEIRTPPKDKEAPKAHFDGVPETRTSPKDKEAIRVHFDTAPEIVNSLNDKESSSVHSASPKPSSQKSEPVSPTLINHYMESVAPKVINQSLDIASPRPVNKPSESKLVNQPLDQPSPNSPRLLNHQLESMTVSLSTPSPHSDQTALYRSPHSPPPSAPSPFWGQAPPGTTIFDPNQPYPPTLTYVNNPPQFAPPIPYFPGPPPGEHYYPPPYCGPPYMSVPQHSVNPADLHNLPPQGSPYYANYVSPQQIQAPFHPLRTSSVRGRSPTDSRRSYHEEQQYANLQLRPPSVNPPEKSFPVERFDHEREDDSGNLLHRIQSAIPDLHLLLNRYQETSGQLEVRKSLIRETEAQKTAALRQKETYIERLGRELESVSSKHTAESTELRHEIGNMGKKQKDLEDDLFVEKKAKAELEAANRALRLEKETTERRLTEEKNNMARDIKLWREKEVVEHDYKLKALETELEHQKQERQAEAAEMTKHHAKEKEELQTGWFKQRQELEESHMRIRRDLETALEAQQRVAEGGHQNYMQDREAWNKERESLSQSWGEERAILGKGWEEQRKILAARHQSEKDEMHKKWQASQSRGNKLAEEENQRLQKDIENLRAGWEADKAKFTKATGEMRSAVMKLNEENAKLQKLAEAFGEVTDLKSREDPFYDDAFHHLYKQISDLTADHFRDAIDDPPGEVLKSIPPTIPPFFSNTESSIKLRAAYVEYLISTIISRRIFQPFLFTISLRHGNPDLLFQSMSDHLRKKSTRREALWRQRTLHAAYTISSAKQSINKIAAYIVDEVVDAIKYFTNQIRWEQVTVAVRRIIKTAAETWRYARLEVAMITASATADDRPDFQRASNRIEPIPDISASGTNQQRQLLLSLFPIIEREAIHEDIREEAQPQDRGYIYFPGRMLYSDDPIIIIRLEEIQKDEMTLRKDETQQNDDERLENHVDEGNKDELQTTEDEKSAKDEGIFLTNGANLTPPRTPTRTRSGSDPQLGTGGPLLYASPAKYHDSATMGHNNVKWEADQRSEFEMSPNSSLSSPRRQLLRRDSTKARKYSSGGSPSSGGRSASTSDATRSSSTTRPVTLPGSWGGSLGGIVFPRGSERW